MSVEEDYDKCLTLLNEIFVPEQSDIWMHSYNHNLNSRPVDVLKVRGISEVLDAIEVERQCAY